MTTDKPSKTPWVKAMDFLSRRDHSEMELREKLGRTYTQEEIDETIKEVTERGWLLPPEELAAKVTLHLHSKKKGFLYIQQFLQRKGLPNTSREPETEYQKALSLIESKIHDPSDSKRLVSLLKNRGFDTETIARVINEIRRSTQSLY